MKEETVRDDYEAPKIRAYGTMKSIVREGGSGHVNDGDDLTNPGNDERIDPDPLLDGPPRDHKTVGDDFSAFGDPRPPFGPK